jgi:hypothetical protein
LAQRNADAADRQTHEDKSAEIGRARAAWREWPPRVRLVITPAWEEREEEIMSLRDILLGIQNGPRGAPQLRSGGRGGGISPLVLALLGLLAYKTPVWEEREEEISLPVQGTAAADAVTATRVLKDLVNSFAPITTITLRLEWNAPGARLLLQVSPVTLPAER